jgi:regulator of replication initiation timing
VEESNRKPLTAALTPSAFLDAMAGKINRMHDGETTPVALRGIPIKRSGIGKVYAGFVYVGIKDPRTNDVIDARIPEQMLGQVDWGKEALITGLIRYKSSQGLAKPEFRIDDIRQEGDAKILAKDELLARWSKVIARAKRDIGRALSAPVPRIIIITGVASVAVDDVRAQLKDAEEDVELDIRRVSIVRPAEVMREIRQSVDAHLLLLTRGGGQEVHDLDDDDLIEAVASSPVPMAVALGHASDNLVLSRVADASFPTPTAFGNWLRSIVDQKRAQVRQTEAAKQIDQTKGLLEQVGTLKGQAKALIEQVASLRGQNQGLSQEAEKLRQARLSEEAKTASLTEQVAMLVGQRQALAQEVKKLGSTASVSGPEASWWRKVAIVFGLAWVMTLAMLGLLMLWLIFKR